MFAWFKKLFGKSKQEWGGTKVLWQTPYGKVTHIWIEAGRATETYTSQDFAVKDWLFLKGSGDYTVGAMRKKILPGTHPIITAGTKHSIQATNEKVEVLEIQHGAPAGQTLQLPSPSEPAQLPAVSAEKAQ